MDRTRVLFVDDHVLVREGLRRLPQDRSKQASNGFQTLSDREKQVFFLLIEGNTSQQISEVLCVSQKTLEKHRASLCKKLGLSSPVEMLKICNSAGDRRS